MNPLDALKGREIAVNSESFPKRKTLAITSQFVTCADNEREGATDLAINFPAGTSLDRPVEPILGEHYFDTTLGAPIWFDGLNWINYAGVVQFTPELIQAQYRWVADTNVTTPGGAVSAWDSVSGISATQGTAGSRPAHSNTNANWNNLPAITGDGGDSLLVDVAEWSLANQRFFHDNTSDWEIQMPYRASSLPSNRGVLGNNDAMGPTVPGFTFRTYVTGAIAASLSNGSAQTETLTSSLISAGTKYVIGARYNATTRLLQASIDGVFALGDTCSFTPSTSNSTYSMRLFSAGNGNTPCYGSTPDIMIAKRILSTNERTNLINYWSTKYAI